MGGSIAPIVPIEWPTENRREFNFWWDPEAVHMVLTSPWHKITITTVDISVKTRLTHAMIAEIAKSPTPTAQYIGKYADEEYLWDELAAGGLARSQHHHQRSIAVHGHRYFTRRGLWQCAGLGARVATWTGRATRSRSGRFGQREVLPDVYGSHDKPRNRRTQVGITVTARIRCRGKVSGRSHRFPTRPCHGTCDR